MTYIPDGSLSPSGGGGPGFGEKLFGWNKLDVSQFDGTSLLFEDDIGNGPAGSVALSYVAAGYKGLPVLRITATGVQGGALLRINASEITLPRRYTIRLRVVQIDTSFLELCVGPFGHDDGDTEWRGGIFRRTGGSTAFDFEHTSVQAGTQRTRVTGALAGSADNTGAAAWANRGGDVFDIDVFRPDGSGARTDWYMKAKSWSGISRDEAVLDGVASGVAAGWDSQDLDRLAIGAQSSTSARSGIIDLLDFQVFAAP